MLHNLPPTSTRVPLANVTSVEKCRSGEHNARRRARRRARPAPACALDYPQSKARANDALSRAAGRVGFVDQSARAALPCSRSCDVLYVLNLF